MNFDVLYIICEQYGNNLEDLAILAEASDHFIPVVRHIFKRNYPNMTSLEILDQGCSNIGVDMRKRDNILTDDNNFIKYFGDYFTKISIKYHSAHNTPEKIEKFSETNEIINLYCADTLIELEIHSEALFDFDVMKRPFEKLEILSLSGNFKISAHTFNTTFPSLQELSLHFVYRIEEKTFLTNHYPQLKRVCLDASPLQNSKPFDLFRKFFRKNPQIHTFTMKNNVKGVLEAVNELLPNLEHLELHKYHSNTRREDGDIILFENVKNFTMVYDYPPKNIEFKNLIEVRSSGNLHYHQLWADFVEKNPKLQRLYVRVPFQNDDQVKKLAAVASNLTDIFLEFRKTVSNENILNLVRHCPKLKRMHLDARFLSEDVIRRNYSFESVAVLLREEFGNEFEIVTESEKQLLMKRLDSYSCFSPTEIPVFQRHLL